MSLRPRIHADVPEETAMVARAAFPRGCMVMRLRDTLGPVSGGARFAHLFPRRGRPAEAPWRLALVTLLQFAENLSDRQAADAVRGRPGWKCLLALPLADPGFDSTVLCEFRARLVAGRAEHELPGAVLAVAVAQRLVRAGGKVRTDSTHLLAAVRMRVRVDCATEAFRHALNAVAAAEPQWLLAHTLPHWAEHYAGRGDCGHAARALATRRGRAPQLGADGHHLLAAVWADGAPQGLRGLGEVEVLRRVWARQFYLDGQCARWRDTGDGKAPSSLFVCSAHDPDARYGRKRSTTWIGYKAHLTEACDDDLPRAIVHARTATAPSADGEATTPAHAALAAKCLLPREHLAGTGYLDAALLAGTTRDFGTGLVGPVRRDLRWQARSGGGFEAAAFQAGWDEREVNCPRGAKSSSWTALEEAGRHVVKVKFSRLDCIPCPSRVDCAGETSSRRLMTLRDRAGSGVLKLARERERTGGFKAAHALRAGAGATISQAVRAFGLRRSRHVGLAKTRLQHVATAAAMNLVRICAWLDGDPVAPTRQSHFGRLVRGAAAL